MQIHHELIGKFPQAEQFRDTLPDLIARYELTRRSADGALICMCAQHFYGLSFVEDFETVEELIDAIRSIDQQLEFN